MLIIIPRVCLLQAKYLNAVVRGCWIVSLNCKLRLSNVFVEYRMTYFEMLQQDERSVIGGVSLMPNCSLVLC